MPEKLFTVYKSSAGSGKTYTLTRDYLSIALRRPDKFKRILAVTFTNKATQEMKERIIETLHKFSSGQQDEMFHFLADKLDLSAVELQSKSRLLLSNILHQYSRFSIQTIDTFFQSVTRSFSRELEIHGDGELLLDSTETREQVIDLLLEDISENEQLRSWLLEFSSDKLENAKSWDVRKDILEFSQQLTNEDFLSIDQELEASIKDGESIATYKKELLQIVHSFEKKMKAIGKEGVKYLEDNMLSLSDFYQAGRGPAAYFDNIVNKDKWPPNSYVMKVLEDEDLMVKKKDKRREELVSHVPHLIGLIAKAVKIYKAEYPTYISAQAILKNIYNLGILWLYQQKLNAYKQEEGILFISDATLFLQRIIGDEETPFIYEKMGSFFDHFLIDEFQDTSAFQWNNFKPLINNSLDQGYHNIVVGDVKQSIYRWRGGDWRLLLSQLKEDVRSHAYEERSLDKNYRSAPNVIDFNNDLFGAIPEQMQGKLAGHIGEEEDPEVLQMLAAVTEAYKGVKQGKKEEYAHQGFVDIQFFEKEDKEEEEDSWQDRSMTKLAKDIERLQDAGVALSDMAILVRNGKQGKLISDFLMQYKNEDPHTKYKYDVISNDSLYLYAAESVMFLVNCFKYLYATKDRVALAQLLYYYQKTILQSKLNEDEIFLACHKQKEEEEVHYLLPQAFVEQKKDLLNRNLLDLSEQLIQYFNLGSQQKEIPYLQAFQDVLLDYGNKGNIQDFLEWWEHNQSKFSVKMPESVNAIRLMTIHKSKGLQFKVVFVPFLDWTVNHGQFPPMLWLRADKETLPQQIPYTPIQHAKNLMESVFKVDYWVEEIKSYLDNLNMLYVAFTRAEQALIAGAEAKTKDSKMGHYVETFLTEKKEWDAEENRYTVGEINDISPSKTQEKGNEEAVYLTDYPSSDWRNKLEVKKGKAIKLSEAKASRSDKINLGLLVHEVFSRMKHLSDQSKVMKSIWAQNGLSQHQLDQLDKLVTENINQHKQLRAWFETKKEVRTEVAIIDPNGKDMRLDRVHLEGETAEVIDFKTGKEKAEDEAQMRQYIHALKAMGYTQVEAKLAYLNPFKIVEVK